MVSYCAACVNFLALTLFQLASIPFSYVSSGVQGMKGEVGEQGPMGPKGGPGDMGDLGPQGDIGVEGLMGNNGTEGPTGETGPKGPNVRSDQFSLYFCCLCQSFTLSRELSEIRLDIYTLQFSL